jgi:hypothetical protein
MWEPSLVSSPAATEALGLPSVPEDLQGLPSYLCESHQLLGCTPARLGDGQEQLLP